SRIGTGLARAISLTDGRGLSILLGESKRQSGICLRAPPAAAGWDAGRAAWDSRGGIINRARGGGGAAGRPRDAWESSAGAGRAGANHSVAARAWYGKRLARGDAAGGGHQRVLGIDLGGVRAGARSALAVRRRDGGVTLRSGC